MKKNRGLLGLLWCVSTFAILVPTLALGILIGSDIASKKVVNDFNAAIETTFENAINGSSVPNSVKGTGNQDSTQAILNDYKAYLESQR